MENTEQETQANDQLDAQSSESTADQTIETSTDTEQSDDQIAQTPIEVLPAPPKAATAEVHIITQADMNNYPELKDQGVDVGSVVPFQSLWVYGGKNEAEEAEEERHKVGFPHPSYN